MANSDQQRAAQQNARAWDALAKQQAALARPARDEDFRDPLKKLDPLGWLGGNITGRRMLCLAAGGGRQSVLYAAAGAEVTVVDISEEMLAQDRTVATERGLSVRTIQASMDSLPMLVDGEFDVVVQPVSTCYVPDVVAVYREVARVLRSGGIYVSQHKSPTSLQTAVRPGNTGYAITEPYYRPYYRNDPLPPAEPSRLRETGAQEFLHRWEELLGGLCRTGFVIEDFVEPMHASADANPGTFAHRARYIAPYLRIKARRLERG